MAVNEAACIVVVSEKNNSSLANLSVFHDSFVLTLLLCLSFMSLTSELRVYLEREYVRNK